MTLDAFICCQHDVNETKSVRDAVGVGVGVVVNIRFDDNHALTFGFKSFF